MAYHHRPDDRSRVLPGDYVRICNCMDSSSPVCKCPKGIFVRIEWDQHSINGSLFDAWVVVVNGTERKFVCTRPIRIINECRRSSKE